MPKMPRLSALFSFLIFAPALLLCATARAQSFPVEVRAPLFQTAPQIDGVIADDEWRGAVRFDGFAWGGQLEKNRATGWAGATRDTLFFAIRTQLPAQGELVSETARDSENLVFDDSLEVWLDATPGAERGRRFQLLANARGFAWGKLHPYGGAPDEPNWKPAWTRVMTLHDGVWDYEFAIPIASIAPNRSATDGAWGFNLTRNWKNEWGFSSLTGDSYQPQARLVFVENNAPVVAQISRGEAFNASLDNALQITNPGTAPLTVKATLRVERDVMPEIKSEEILTLAPGESREISTKTADTATKKFKQFARVVSPDEKTIYFQRQTAWSFAGPFLWVAKKKEIPPLDFQFAYYPYANKMRILADVSNLPKGAKLQSLQAVISDAINNKTVKTVRFDNLQNGKQQLEFSLPPLRGEHQISMRATGENVPTQAVIKTFERRVFEWEKNTLGRSTKVYAPFTPIKTTGAKIATVLREHEMTGAGLWKQVVAAGQPLLAAPMRWEAKINGQVAPFSEGKLQWTKTAPHEAAARGSWQAGELKTDVRISWDYDGMMRLDLALQPTTQTVDSLDLIVPLNAQATMIHAMGDGIRNTIYKKIPNGEGVVWSAKETQSNDLPPQFCTYVFVGNANRGLCWFAENDKGWSRDEKVPNLDLFRQNGQLFLRVHLINSPTKISAPQTITFGLQAAPVKPKFPADWRHKWRRENYSLLGTDINWLALGDCGSVYPAGRDLSFWEAIARGNKTRLGEAEINAVIERGKPYFAPYGNEKVQSFIAHVRHNLQSRYGHNMVFYYNRASYQAAEEFETFKDEWSLTDYRTTGKGNGIWEIKIVPSESYIDHALYWYAKSFEIGNNKGVYWDNWFFQGSYNTAMTDAYQKPDSSIVASTGIWGLRELCKRTFQMMNEKNMMPLTMAHMTSTNILPLLSFATVQYDWEWKYSEGDVQGRFPREYLQLVSNGELAGAWPVILGDHGKQEDDLWTGRTFAAVALLHELDCSYSGWTKTGKMQRALFQPIDELIGKPGLRVYRYWDEAQQPIKSDNADLPSIVYALPGQQAIAAIVSYADKDETARVTIDAKTLGLKNFTVTDTESGAPLTVENGAVSFRLKKHDVKIIKVAAR